MTGGRESAGQRDGRHRRSARRLPRHRLGSADRSVLSCAQPPLALALDHDVHGQLGEHATFALVLGSDDCAAGVDWLALDMDHSDVRLQEQQILEGVVRSRVAHGSCEEAGVNTVQLVPPLEHAAARVAPDDVVGEVPVESVGIVLIEPGLEFLDEGLDSRGVAVGRRACGQSCRHDVHPIGRSAARAGWQTVAGAGTWSQ